MWEYSTGYRVTVEPPSSPAAAVLPVAVVPTISPPSNYWPLQVWFFKVFAGYICLAGVDAKLVLVFMERTIRHLTGQCLSLITIIFTAATLLTKKRGEALHTSGKRVKEGSKNSRCFPVSSLCISTSKKSSCTPVNRSMLIQSLSINVNHTKRIVNNRNIRQKEIY